ncbi:hypothetical protein ABL78_1840 [Leptomonas seymouri]|uniref:C-CAP/cofactor C-like domain-containing protein n=1 Tax=Leptomonas seymouri TaxID=5684 RepID=A0A0N0P826_LEPSE|nr:hypothetical protein ABL78_1840 [Leptomonas seymouri]|eukprot:KPI89027.1 hypothetical protein ABL78_1840 [Leptomonas seymouri]
MEVAATPSDHPVPNVEEVQASFHKLIRCGHKLHTASLTAAQEQLLQVVREHTQALLHMETHGRPTSVTADGVGDESWRLVSFHAVYDNACKSIRDSIAGLRQLQHDPRETNADQVTCLLRCVETLVQALGWVLQPASPTPQTADIMSVLQHRLSELSAQATGGSFSDIASHSTRAGDTENNKSAAADWLNQANAALCDLACFATKTYPHGAWFANRNRRAVVRSRRVRHPSDVGDAPFQALVLASHSTEDDDVTLLSEAMLSVAQAYTRCLAAVRSTEVRPTELEALAEIFAPLNSAINELSSTCEDVINRREDDRPHAHAVLEACNIFTWLTSRHEPCVVVEEAFGSANTYLTKVAARGNMLLLQQEMGLAVDRPDLTKAMLTWASMLREALQRVMLMVIYRYPQHVPWGEMIETTMPRNPPPLPTEPRRGAHGGPQPVWRRSAAASASRTPVAPSAQGPEAVPHSHPVPPPASSLPPPPPPPPAAAEVNATAPFPAPTAPNASPVATSMSVAFDSATSTWTVQHYRQPLLSAVSGEEQEPVYVVLPEEEVQWNHSVHILHCFNAYVTVPKKVKGVTVQHCQHTKLQLAGAIGPVRVSDSERQEMLIEASAPSVYAKRVTGLVLHLAGSHETEIITALTTDVNVNVVVKMADGDQEVRELALPAQFISTVGDGDALHTREVTYSG